MQGKVQKIEEQKQIFVWSEIQNSNSISIRVQGIDYDDNDFMWNIVKEMTWAICIKFIRFTLTKISSIKALYKNFSSISYLVDETTHCKDLFCCWFSNSFEMKSCAYEVNRELGFNLLEIECKNQIKNKCI